MGGKTKLARVKNNAKPSSSSRSAQLLGNSVSAFVGFSAHSEHGVIPFAPGFSDIGTDSGSLNVDPQLQLILRKMIKKDPVTKVKALREFKELLDSYDLDAVKNVLPLWPKLYHNLSNDVDHRVRQSAQEVMNAFAVKCKKSIAPCLKQLVPTWIASSFDDYAPAASIARLSFNSTFPSITNKVREVCLFCQNEILEYVARNLTHHTVSTFSTKHCTPEDADQKYQRIVYCSLKTLSFFLEVTNCAENIKIEQCLQDMLNNSKFWSFSKSKDRKVKASWFEVLLNVLQSEWSANVVTALKSQIIATCFQNIEECEPLVASNVWSCIMLVQLKFEDWYKVINFDKAVMPKLSALLRKGFNKNVDAICPNLLPFLSKISPEVLKDGNISDFRKRFFDDIKEALTTAENITKAEYSAITASYFECLRFVMKQINITWQEKSEDERSPLKLEANQLLRENIIDLLIWCLTKEGPVVKFIMQHVSTLITFWADPVRDSNLYVEMVDTFWSSINSFIIADLVNKKDDEIFLNRVIELIEKLYFGNPKMEDQKVKFDLKEASAIEEAILKKSTNFELCKKERSIRQVSLSAANEQQAENLLRRPSSKAYIESDLRNLVIQLIRLCLEKSNNELGSNYILKARKVFNLFNDADFYAQVSEEKTIRGTLNMFLGIMEHLESTACENVIDMIFEVLTYLPKCEKIDFIEKNLLKVPQLHVQHLVINRLLSYPLISEPEVRAIISNPKASNIIKDFAQHVLTDNCKESLIILRKCFFQNDAGEIPIDQKTVEEIIRSLSQPLAANTGMDGQAELCASFIAQIMPVVCGEGNTSLELQRHIFLKLFRFSIEHLFDDGISEDTLWETSTCWQDALSSQDIIADMQLLRECKAIVQNYLQKNNLTTEVIEELATAVTQLAICSTEHITDEKERLLQLDITIKELCRTETNRTLEQTYKLCLFLEALLGKVYLDKKLTDDCMEDFEKLVTFRQILLNACIIYKIVCKSPKIRAVTEYDSEGNEISQAFSVLKDRDVNQWSATLYDEAFQCISMASIADSLRNSIPKMESALEMVLIQLSEKAKLILANGCDDFISQLKSYMLEKAIKDEDISVVRALLYLVHANQYSQFEENATILLFEDLSEYLLTRNSLKVYVSALQLFLPHLCSNIITTQNPIMQTKLTGISIRAAVLRCLVQNNFSCDYNAMSDRDIIGQTINFLLEISQINHVNKEAFLYNVEIHKQSFENVVDIVEFIELLKEVITKFPYELTIKNWDAIQIGLSLWVLSVSKSIEQLKNPQVALVTAKVFELYATLTNFISNEKQKSSTEFLTNIFDEWESLFARDVNLVLFKTYYNLVEHQGLVFKYSTCYEMLLQVITPAMDHINYEVVYKFHKTSKQISIENVLTFLLKNLSNKVHCIRTMSLKILKKMAQYYIATDFAAYENKIESINFNSDAGDWHFLKIMEEYIERYGTPVYKYLPEFSFKLSEIAELKSVDQDECLPYLFLWDCIIYVCANSPITLRSLYTNWLHEKLYEENFLHFLFRAMPTEILKNYDSKLFSSEAFKGLTWRQIQDPTLPVEKYVCHLYTEVLRKLPAVVRRWWNVCHSRQKTYVDKLTTNFVSPIICNEELKALSNKRDKHDNMQVTVHTSTREVLAVYFIDEARMELIIKLTQNYPLGSVKVEIGKQIGGRLSSRNTGMQLTIFLTHQNGSILDGLALWKKNLDKKFEGVEECYVCYTVIHQDTCQLPKLTCKTCKKKFHGPCLYKWFTTSSKSTCPICRNVF